MSKISRQSVQATEPFLLTLAMLRRVRSGNKLSRLGRIIFERKNIRRILGSNLAVAVIATSLIPTTTSAEALEAEPTIITENSVNLSTERAVAFPVRKIILTQGYRLFHPGLDLDGVTGDTINPIMDGEVTDIQYSRFAYGNAIIIAHTNGLESLYAHLSKIEVKKGDKVTTLTKIAEMGSTGHSSGDHLHLEVRKNGHPVNPFTVLPRLQ